MKPMMSLILCLFFMSPITAFAKPNGKALFTDLGCIKCHDANMKKKMGPFPIIKLKTAKEIQSALSTYRAGKKRGPMSKVMSGNTNVKGLSDADIAAIAGFLKK
ncbi:MAG: c-type cytochrome [SAR324 cluster bacterium]|nr:c-type cytochrome [SAR324 cluster bacterium]